MAEPAAKGTSGKVVIRNVGLMLSGDLDRPILDADTVVVRDGRIAAVGREADCDTSTPDVLVDARGTTLAPGLIDTPIYGEGEASEQFKERLSAGCGASRGTG